MEPIYVVSINVFSYVVYYIQTFIVAFKAIVHYNGYKLLMLLWHYYVL
jgi:hypothetical protein